MRIRSLFFAASCLVMTGTASCLCGEPSADVVGADPYEMDLYVGEKTRVRGSAESLNEFCGKSLDDSYKDPGAYAFSTADASVATVSSTGDVTATGPGKTTITVSRSAVKGFASISVTRPIAEVRIAATPASPVVGDTVDAVTQAIDYGGQIATNARFTGLYVDPILAAGGTNPVVLYGPSGHLRFVIKSPGRYILRDTFRHGGSGISARLEIVVP